MHRLRLTGLTMLALAVPTFAFGGEQAPSGPQSLSVSASLGGCGLAEATIVCQIDTSWDAIEGAEYYSVSVTRPDGSVLDLGQGGGTSRSVFVPYVGSGSYSIQVSAWGTPPGDDDAQVLARDRATSTDTTGNASRDNASRATGVDGPDAEAPPDQSGNQDGDVHEQPASGDDGTASPPGCPAEEEEPAEGDSELSEEEAAARAAEAELALAEQYDPADADGNGGCPLSASP